MRKAKIAGLIFGFLIMVTAMGCGDDDCPSCPEPSTPLGYARGSIILSPGTVIPMLEFFGNTTISLNPDSLKVGDSLVGKEHWSLFGVSSYADAHWAVMYFEGGDTSTFMYHHGDLATINVWGEGRSSSCQLKVLDPSLAMAHITDPLPNADTVFWGTSDTIYWNKVEYADYYAIMIPWWVEIGGGRWEFTFDYASDTSYVVTGDMFPDSTTAFDVVVTPFTGPDPRTGKTNWTGSLVDGMVYSFGANNITTVHVIPPIILLPEKSSAIAKKHRDWNPQEIVSEVYQKYSK